MFPRSEVAPCRPDFSTPPRQTMFPLDGLWQYARDAENDGVSRGWTGTTAGETRPVETGRPWEYWDPGHDGTGWYWKTFTLPADRPDGPCRLFFEGAGYRCDCWVNGHPVGTHEGLTDPFFFDIAPALQPEGENLLAVRIINPPLNRKVEGLRSGSPLNQSDIPIGKAGWYYNYGGLWGRVRLAFLPEAHFEDVCVQPDRAAGVLRVTWTLSSFARAAGGEVHLAIRDSRTGRAAGREASSIHSVTGEASGEAALGLDGMEDWSPSHPVLYDLEARLVCGESAHAVRRRFGVRSFTIEGKDFLLNGRRIILKGLLQQRAYPRRLAAPDSWRIAARELLLMKRAGFNFLRIHLGPAELWYLDLADRLGILVMMEPPIGWIANGPNTEARIRREIIALLHTHRSRTCVVMWGLFNESFHLLGFGPGEMHALAGRMLRVAREADRSRLIIDTSGGYARVALQGAETMIHDTFAFAASRAMLPWSDAVHPVTDVHVYCAMPPTPAVVDNYADLDAGSQLLFLAEFGAAEAPPDFDRVLAGYSPAEARAGLEDWRLHHDFHTSLERRFEQADLAPVFGAVRDWIEAVNLTRAREVAAITLAIRSNPGVAGFCYCQIADASGELFGVLDFWRRPKPLYHALAAAIASPAAGVRVKKNWITPSEPLEVTAQVAADPDLAIAGRLTVTVANSDGSRRIVLQEDGEWNGSISRTTSVTGLPEGVHRIEAAFRPDDGRASRFTEEIGVIAETAAPSLAIAARFAAPESHALAARCGLDVEPFGNNFRNKNIPILLEWRAIAHQTGAHCELLGQMRNIAETGGAVVILNPDTPMLYHWLLPAFVAVQPVMRTAAYIRPSAVFEGLPAGCVAGSLYAGVIGERWDNGDHVAAAGGTIEVGAFSMHMWTRPAKYFWGASVYRLPLGKGQIIISHLDLTSRLATDPLARRLLGNLARYAASFIRPGGEELLLRRCIDRVTDPM